MENNQKFREIEIDNYICIDYDLFKTSKDNLENTMDNECNVKFSVKHEKILEAVYKNCEDNIQRRVIAEYFVNTFVVKEILYLKDQFKVELENVEKQIKSLIESNYSEIIKNYIGSYLQEDIVNFMSETEKSRINFLLCNISNVFLQQAINNFISSRLPFGVSIYSNKKLSTYYDQMGNLLQCPHDYLRKESLSTFQK